MRGFREAVDTCGLLDLGLHGDRFTWQRGRIRERLDRFLADANWMQLFPFSQVSIYARYKSDHAALISDSEIKAWDRNEERGFKFEPTWLAHEECKQIVRSAWQDAGNVEIWEKN